LSTEKTTHPGTGRDHRGPPGAPVRGGLVRHEAQEVDLLADLGDQGENDAAAQAEARERDSRDLVVLAAEAEHSTVRARLLDRDRQEWCRYENQPDRLRPYLQLG
jgi:hypothetical protein